MARAFQSRHEGFAPVTFPFGIYFSNRKAQPARPRLATRLEKRLFPAPLNCPPPTLPNRLGSEILLEALPSRFGSEILLDTLPSTIRGGGGADVVCDLRGDAQRNRPDTARIAFQFDGNSSANADGPALVNFGKRRSEGAQPRVDEENAMPAADQRFPNLSRPSAFQNRIGSGAKLTRIRHALSGVCSKVHAGLLP